MKIRHSMDLRHPVGAQRVPLTEEIRLEIFGFPDLPDFREDLLRDGDSIYSHENAFSRVI